jgi:putative phosphoesterase
MRIGILADTHDNLPMVERAVSRLNGLSPDLVLHAGDFVAPFVIPRLASLSCPCIGVFGNNDGDRALLAAKAREAGNVEIHGCFTVRQAGGRSIALLHGHEPDAFGEITGAGIFDVVVHGHSHQPSISEIGGTLVVNPGGDYQIPEGEGNLFPEPRGGLRLPDRKGNDRSTRDRTAGGEDP